MAELLTLAWRNIWRNSRRTLITTSSIGLGLGMLLFSQGLNVGMINHMINTSTASLLGHAQVHREGYRESGDVEQVLEGGTRLLQQALTNEAVESAAPRTIATGLLAMGDRSAGATILGIDPKLEPTITNWKDRLVEGEYITDEGDALIGRDLAETLELSLGSKIVLTLADAKTGDLANVLLRIKGILFTNNAWVDKQVLVMPISQLQRTIGLESGIHEIALRLRVPPEDNDAIHNSLNFLKQEGITISSWSDISPMAMYMLEMQDTFMGAVVFIIFLIISFGIVNTLTMSLLERTWEFGVMRAIGTTGGRLSLLIFLEATFLGLVGALVGILFFIPFHWYFSVFGLNMGNVTMGDVSFDTKIYSVLDFATMSPMPPVFVLLTTCVALTTAIRAARLQPVDAMRKV